MSILALVAMASESTADDCWGLFGDEPASTAPSASEPCGGDEWSLFGDVAEPVAEAV